MLDYEWNTSQADAIYSEFAAFVGETAWGKRVAHLSRELKGNRFLEDYFLTENSIAYQLEELQDLKSTHGHLPLRQIEQGRCYHALGFAAQIMSISRKVDPVIAQCLKRRVQGAFTNPDDMHGLRLELSTATNFVRRGLRVEWNEPGSGAQFDFLLSDVGPRGLEVECKSVSDDKGRKVHRREVLDFYKLLFRCLKPYQIGLREGLGVVVTVPTRLPKNHAHRVSLANNITQIVISATGGVTTEGVVVRVFPFAASLLGHVPSTSPAELRKRMDLISATTNQQFAILGNSRGGGVLAVAIQSFSRDELLKATFDALADSAKTQLTGTRPGAFVVGFQGLDRDQLIEIGASGFERSAKPTALRVAVSNFLASSERDHVVAVNFLSRMSFLSRDSGVSAGSGSVYYFPRREASGWHADFEGMFSNE